MMLPMVWKTIRTMTRRYDAAGNLLQENQHSETYGLLTSEWRYDAYGNKVQETTNKGVSGEELVTRYTYDGMNQLTLVNFGPQTIYNSDGSSSLKVLTQQFTYDGAGNRSTQINERNYIERFYYDDHNRLITQWDLADPDNPNSSPALGGSSLRTEYSYDNFYRVEQRRQIDLTKLDTDPGRVRFMDLLYNHYDELIRITEAERITQMGYDKSGNQISETNARGFTEYYDYDGEKQSNLTHRPGR